MLYNHELLRKLRIGAYVLAVFLLVYAVLTFRDNNLSQARLWTVSACLSVSVIIAWFLKKPTIPVFITYAVTLALVFVFMLFRIRANLALDVTLLAVSVGLLVGFWSQAKKKSEFAKFE